MDEPKLTLHSDGLLSKWGFNDGDMPDPFWDWLDERDPTGYERYEWHPVLRRLVREHLVPKLDQRVEVIDIETNHNPVRASTVDGINVEGHWYDTDPPVTLTPESVEVPYTDVFRVMRELEHAPA